MEERFNLYLIANYPDRDEAFEHKGLTKSQMDGFIHTYLAEPDLTSLSVTIIPQ